MFHKSLWNWNEPPLNLLRILVNYPFECPLNFHSNSHPISPEIVLEFTLEFSSTILRNFFDSFIVLEFTLEFSSTILRIFFDSFSDARQILFDFHSSPTRFVFQIIFKCSSEFLLNPLRFPIEFSSKYSFKFILIPFMFAF